MKRIVRIVEDITGLKGMTSDEHCMGGISLMAMGNF
jgi:hypothetical protein